MTLVKAWAAALLAGIVGAAVQVLLFGTLGTVQRLDSWTWAALLVYLPWFVTMAATVVTAGMASRRVGSPGRRALAALSLPALVLMAVTVVGWGADEPLRLLYVVATGVAGAAAGWLVTAGLGAARAAKKPLY